MSLIVWKSLKNLSVVFYSRLFSITLKASNHYDISLNNFQSPNKQVKYLSRLAKSLFSRFFSSKTNLFSITKKILQDMSLYIWLQHQKHKCPICVIRKGYPETKICQISSFSNNFCNWNLNNKETFLFCF